MLNLNKRSLFQTLPKILFIYALALFLASFSFRATAEESNLLNKKSTSSVPQSKETKSTQKKEKSMYALFETNKGTFKVKLFNDQAPQTVANFADLAEGTKEWTDPKSNKKVKKPFYDGLKFHRIIDGFMIQGGDPLGNGSGGPGFTIKDELHPALKHSKAGILSMAKTQEPHSGGSQFFITVRATPHLDGIHSVFGEVVEGMDVVMAIAKVKTNRMDDSPIDPVIMNKIKIIRN